MEIKIFLIAILFSFLSNGAIITYQGIANDSSLDVSWKNGQLFNQTLQNLKPGDVFIIPNNTFYTMGGIKAENLTGVTIQIDGTIAFSGKIHVKYKFSFQ